MLQGESNEAEQDKERRYVLNNKTPRDSIRHQLHIKDEIISLESHDNQGSNDAPHKNKDVEEEELHKLSRFEWYDVVQVQILFQYFCFG